MPLIARGDITNLNLNGNDLGDSGILKVHFGPQIVDGLHWKTALFLNHLCTALDAAARSSEQDTRPPVSVPVHHKSVAGSRSVCSEVPWHACQVHILLRSANL